MYSNLSMWFPYAWYIHLVSERLLLLFMLPSIEVLGNFIRAYCTYYTCISVIYIYSDVYTYTHIICTHMCIWVAICTSKSIIEVISSVYLSTKGEEKEAEKGRTFDHGRSEGSSGDDKAAAVGRETGVLAGLSQVPGLSRLLACLFPRFLSNGASLDGIFGNFLFTFDGWGRS